MAEPLVEWVYSGFVPIERFGPEGVTETKIPFVLRTPFSQPLSAEDVVKEALEVAKSFLNMLQDTAPAHRDDYGEIGIPVVEIAGPALIGKMPGER